MKSLALILVVLCLSLTASPQALAPPATAEFDQGTGLPNGRMWLEMTREERNAWLLGFSNGVFCVEGIVHTTGSTEPSQLDKFLSALYESKLTLGEKVQGITHFYQDTPENAPIIVPSALEYVTSKANGATEAQLDDLVSGFRKAGSTEK